MSERFDLIANWVQLVGATPFGSTVVVVVVVVVGALVEVVEVSEESTDVKLSLPACSCLRGSVSTGPLDLMMSSKLLLAR